MRSSTERSFSRGAFRRRAGVAVGGSSLVLISLDRANGAFEVAPSVSAHLVLRDDSQAALRQLHDELTLFVSYAGFDSLVVRSNARRDRYQPGSDVRRMEAALELVSNLVIERVNDVSLRAWMRYRASELPAPAADMNLQDQRLHTAAAAAAHLAICMAENEVELVDKRIRPIST